MSRIKLLQPHEIKEFDCPIVLTTTQQNHYFEIQDDLATELDKLRHPCSKIGMLLQWGYFKLHGRFFEVADFRIEDTQYVAQQLKINLKYLDFHRYYNKQIAYEHRERILSIIHWQPFQQEVFEHQIELLVEQQLMPRKVLYQTQEYLFRQGMEAPAYDKYRKVITQALLSSSKCINQSLEMYLTAEYQLVLDEFLDKEALSQRSEIVQYKIINQATNPKSIRHNLELFLRLQDRVFRLAPLIEQLNLSDATIDYHAHWVGIAEVHMLRIHSDKYLFLLCFLIRQVHLRQDYFIDIILNSVTAAENKAKSLQKEDYFHRQRKRKAATQLLITSRNDYKQQVGEIRGILKEDLTAQDKVEQIESVVAEDNTLTDDELELIENLEDEMTRDEKEDFYKIWQERCVWLSNRIGQVINHLMLNDVHSDENLLEAINHYSKKKGKITAPAKNLRWLPEKEQSLIWKFDTEKDEDVFQRKLYKMLLFKAIHDGVKSGILSFNCSYRFRFVEDYLIPKEEWEARKEQLLADTEMSDLSDCTTLLEGMESNLDQLYHQVNDNYNLGLNPHLSFDKNGKPIVHTPEVEKFDISRIDAYFKTTRFIPIYDLLSDVEKIAPFLHHLGHQSKTHEKKRPSAETFFASIIALGCNIGVEKMRNISKGIQVSSLQHTADWYLSEQALEDANNAIIKIKNELSLPELHRKSPNELHTASDGQKVLSQKKSLNATFSYKYPGYTKAAVVNTAIDERFAIFSSAVITASEREAISMIDLLLGNPVVKSTIHSTDTHGSTEVIFGIMQLLGIYFAPRIKDVGSLLLYGFKSRKEYEALDYQIVPDHYINKKLIEDNWDDILRVVVSLKLGRTSAQQLLKRLNSYAQQNPLHKALKEFGKITRTAFVLRFYDDLELRHSIEKILAHIELMNRFGKAIFFGSNQMFQVATKEEQEKIIMCRTLLQNAIILWNYLYLSELVSKLESQPELEELIDIIRNSTAVAWSHINLLGVYDFTKLLNDSQLRFDLQKLKEWKYKKSA